MVIGMLCRARFALVLAVGVLLGAAFPAAASAETGSFWYALDNIREIDDGARFVLWVTLPPQWHGQEIQVTGLDPDPVTIQTDERSGNKIVEWVWEPDAWEILPEMPARQKFFHFEFNYEAHPVHLTDKLSAAGAQEPVPPEVQRYLEPETWIQTDGRIRDQALRIIGSETDPAAQARLLYDWVVANMTFTAGLKGPRDAQHCLTSLRGDCGHFSNLYTAMCRSIGIPARNLSLAWPVGGLHDLCEIYLAKVGWFPVDTSLGQMLHPEDRDPGHEEISASMDLLGIPEDDPDFFFGNMPENRVVISVGLNQRLESPILGNQVIHQRMRPGGIDANPEAFIAEGFNRSLVHGGFFVLGEPVPDEETAHALTHQRLASSFFDESLDAVTEAACGPVHIAGSSELLTWINLGKVFLHKGEYYKAESAFLRGLRGASADEEKTSGVMAWAHNYLGNCYDLLGRRDMAEAQYQMVVAAGDNFRGAVDYARKYLERPFKKPKS